ncbi:thermonuclease family protein [Ruegeria sp. 2205SS24-7]|uniref:thermonuclease family protein n=1 Tax=Ruegeria discodermiae TaxID=3064389 RepID=UPI0027416673|nr:thermonuclease family protein [Ruegeria sp. 2205SS24-7]MDP5218837.1 thermonuclease family protein [Ruegeria sp. 2205SS24-7]
MNKLLLSCAVLAGLLIATHHLGQTTKVFSASDVFAVDGDTLDHGDDRYRLVGFDTPETYWPQCAAEKALGLKAKARLTELIQKAGQIKLIIEPDLDVHDRFLAVGRVAGENVGNILISEGLARPYGGGKRLSWCI